MLHTTSTIYVGFQITVTNTDTRVSYYGNSRRSSFLTQSFLEREPWYRIGSWAPLSFWGMRQFTSLILDVLHPPLKSPHHIASNASSARWRSSIIALAFSMLYNPKYLLIRVPNFYALKTLLLKLLSFRGYARIHYQTFRQPCLKPYHIASSSIALDGFRSNRGCKSSTAHSFWTSMSLGERMEWRSLYNDLPRHRTQT